MPWYNVFLGHTERGSGYPRLGITILNTPTNTFFCETISIHYNMARFIGQMSCELICHGKLSMHVAIAAMPSINQSLISPIAHEILCTFLLSF